METRDAPRARNRTPPTLTTSPWRSRMARGQRAIAVPPPLRPPVERAVPVSGCRVRRGERIPPPGLNAEGAEGAAFFYPYPKLTALRRERLQFHRHMPKR